LRLSLIINYMIMAIAKVKIPDNIMIKKHKWIITFEELLESYNDSISFDNTELFEFDKSEITDELLELSKKAIKTDESKLINI
jgi:hypothetical protein